MFECNVDISGQIFSDVWPELVEDDLLLVQKVKQFGYPNIYGAKIPVKSCWHLGWLHQQLVNYYDTEVLEFLKYGWPADRLPNMPALTINLINHSSSLRFPAAVNHYVSAELKFDSIMGPFSVIPFETGHVGMSPISTQPKKDSEERHVILDLSYPPGASVNDWTPKDSYLGHNIQLVYPGVDDLACRVKELGETGRLYKRDASHCFRWVPLGPHDYQLFGYHWMGSFYFDKVLTMGHRVAPYMCQRVTRMLKFIQNERGFFLLNYVDDFVGAEHMSVAQQAYESLGEIMDSAGLAENSNKVVPPTPILEFLGVTYNTVRSTMEVSPN